MLFKVGLGSSENCIELVQMHETHATYGAITPLYLKWAESWLLSTYIDAGLYICEHKSAEDTNTMQPTLFTDENISLIVALQALRSHRQKLPTSIIAPHTGSTLND